MDRLSAGLVIVFLLMSSVSPLPRIVADEDGDLETGAIPEGASEEQLRSMAGDSRLDERLRVGVLRILEHRGAVPDDVAADLPFYEKLESESGGEAVSEAALQAAMRCVKARDGIEGVVPYLQERTTKAASEEEKKRLDNASKRWRKILEDLAAKRPRTEQTLAAIALAHKAPASPTLGMESIDVVFSGNTDADAWGIEPIDVVFSGNTDADAWGGALDTAIIKNVFDDVESGRINRHNPQLRNELVWFLEAHPSTPEAYKVFQLMLEGCAGNTLKRRLAGLSSWVRGVEGGRYEGIVTYYAAYHLFRQEGYDDAMALLARNMEKFGRHHDRARMLEALCLVQKGDNERTLGALAQFKNDFPDSALLPEALFLTAWVHFQNGSMDEGKQVLRRLVEEWPESASAAKARQVLSDMAARD